MSKKSVHYNMHYMYKCIAHSDCVCHVTKATSYIYKFVQNIKLIILKLSLLFNFIQTS